MAPEISSENSNNSNNVINYNDPYFISNGDWSTQNLGIQLFNGDNYVNWSRAVCLALSAKNKTCFIDRTLKRPDSTSTDLQKWIRNDYLITCWILKSMEPNLTDSFVFAASTVELWDEIKEMHLFFMINIRI